ncbi:hypothetical protein [Flavobacterium sp. WC2509]|uniref:hypothetical protein n=1 Tax=Flavobacterium sp. WC2509 TaxID=3461406 RepID=UPI00404506FF
MLQKLLYTFLLIVFLQMNGFGQSGTVTSATTGNWNAVATWTAINIPRTGTVTSSTALTTVTGVGTSFLTQLAVGSVITTQLGVVIGTVASINSDISLVLVGNAANTVTNQNYRTTGGTPSPVDTVNIQGSNVITVTANAACNLINFVGNGTINVNTGFSLNITDTITVVTVAIGVLSDRDAFLTGGGTINCDTLVVGLGTGIGLLCNTRLTSTISNFNITGAGVTLNSLGVLTASNNASFYIESGTVNIDGVITTANALLVATTSTLSMSTGAQTGTLLLSNTAPFSLSGLGTNTIILNGTGTTVNYDGAAQTVLPKAYNNLAFSGSGIKSTSNTTSVAGNLYINGATASIASGTTIAAGSLTLGVYKKINGVWGSTTATAAYKDNAYFQPTTGTVTVSTDTRPTAVFSNLTVSQSICFGTAMTTLSGTVSGINAIGGGFYPSAEAIGVTINGVAQNTTTVGSTGVFSVNYTTATLPANITPYNVTYSFTNTVNVNLKNGTNNTTALTVNAIPSVPVQGTITSVTCTAGGTVVLNSLPSGNWTLERTEGNVVSAPTSGSSTLVTDLPTGSYTFKVRNNFGCLSSSAVIVAIPDMPSTTWNGSAWGNGNPDISKKIIMDGGSTTISSSIEGCSCQVNAGVNIIVDANAVLKLRKGLTIIGNGTLTFENGTSLVQLDDTAVNTGNITYKRTTSTIKDYDYVYWSSPVVDRKLGELSPGSDKYWSWLTDNWAPATAATVMLPAKGYIARVPSGIVSVPKVQNVEFVGKPNNGVQTIASQGVNKSNLIGNPYPSAIDADLFMTYNKTIINGALYFWTHRSGRTLNGVSNQYEYAANDYATYTLLGTTGSGGGSASGSAAPLGKIAAGQSFFVDSKRSGNFTFNNSMRISDSGMNSQFFKQQPTKKSTAIERERVWLNLTNDGGVFKQLLVGYMTGATNDFDTLYDGVTFDGNPFVDFYSIANAKNYAVQARGLPFDVVDEVPLGYRTTIAGIFKIGIDAVDGSLADQAIYLEDKITNTIYNLKNGDYSFTTTIGTFADRFVLRYADSSKLLNTEDVQTKGKEVILSVKSGQIKINSFDQNLSFVKVYDLKGSLIFEKNKLGKNELIIDNLKGSNQVMIVITQLEDGNSMSQEIVFHD